MKYLVDTNTASDVINGDPAVIERLRSLQGTLNLSAISLIELYTGANRAETTAKKRYLLTKIEHFLTGIPVVPIAVGHETSIAMLRATLHGLGQPAGDLDELIAGHALALKATLITRDVKLAKKLRKIAEIGMRVVDWSAP